LCTFYGKEGFSLDIFADFERLTEKAKNKLIENLAISKSEADAEITNSQFEKPEFLAAYFEEEDKIADDVIIIISQYSLSSIQTL
jgi:hypothetical protein